MIFNYSLYLKISMSKWISKVRTFTLGLYYVIIYKLLKLNKRKSWKHYKFIMWLQASIGFDDFSGLHLKKKNHTRNPKFCIYILQPLFKCRLKTLPYRRKPINIVVLNWRVIPPLGWMSNNFQRSCLIPSKSRYLHYHL